MSRGITIAMITNTTNAIAAAKAGKMIVCEKPLAMNAEEGLEMVKAVEAAKQFLVVNYGGFNTSSVNAMTTALTALGRTYDVTNSAAFEGKTVAVSASGNVAQYAVQKVNQLGGKVITLSDSNGTVVDKDGVIVVGTKASIPAALTTP